MKPDAAVGAETHAEALPEAWRGRGRSRGGAEADSGKCRGMGRGRGRGRSKKQGATKISSNNLRKEATNQDPPTGNQSDIQMPNLI